MSARVTTLRVTEQGVVLFAAHRARLGPAAERSFDTFAATARSGIYSLIARDELLEVISRPASRLFEGIGVRYAISPVADRRGPFPKEGSPSPYDAVRTPNLATLLTDPDAQEVWESCVAAVFAWDGAQLVAVPEARPRVDSLAERTVAAALSPRRAPLLREAGWPLVLVNAVITCVPAKQVFPQAIRAAIDEAIHATIARP